MSNCVPVPPPVDRNNMYDSAGYHFPPTNDPKSLVVCAYINGIYTPESAGTTLKALQAKYGRVITIDVSGANPEANALDIETGDASPADAAGWVREHVDHYGGPGSSSAALGVFARLYCNLSTWGAVKASVATLSAAYRAHVRYWIANPTGVDHIVPGAAATQWYWGNGWDETSYIDGQF